MVNRQVFARTKGSAKPQWHAYLLGAINRKERNDFFGIEFNKSLLRAIKQFASTISHIGPRSEYSGKHYGDPVTW